MRSSVSLPSISVIMGSILCMVSQLSLSVRFYTEGFITGLVLILFGILSWVLIQIYNISRIRRSQRIKTAAQAQQNSSKSQRPTSIRSTRF